MRTFATLLAGSAAGVLLAAGAAQAGVCSGEIMALQKQMEETPTMASATAPTANSGAAPARRFGLFGASVTGVAQRSTGPIITRKCPPA